MSRISIELILNDICRDYTCFNEKGWFKSAYFYGTSLNIWKKMLGKVFNLPAAINSKEKGTGCQHITCGLALDRRTSCAHGLNG